ncbi:nickel-dependent hydrogenase large subunit [Sulfurovum sp.]|uniref:nickel-dependent hydrogenase large subunit n=1 Tax=Sulfurovum sp. TaxID=1969726 RepID=UPI002867C4AB|nr:nickel-dependent hydrogenase large subunit [Sulfurovum sp.]
MIVKKLIEKVEGEAELDFTMKDGRVEAVAIHFGYTRSIEKILQGKADRDALVITPRVCGICNHAHLMASVRAIENGYENAGVKVRLSDKAKSIRAFTLHCELIQNHVKWFYLVIIPQLNHLLNMKSEDNPFLKASYLSSTITKALAIFAGQWPHSSYAVPGGVTCDPTYVDVMQAQALVEESIRFFEDVLTGLPLDTYLSIVSISSLDKIQGDFGKVLQLLKHDRLAFEGLSHDDFIVFDDSILSPSGKSRATKRAAVDMKYVQEIVQEGTKAKAAKYKGRSYEVGPLARGMVSKQPIIKSLHKRYKDSLMTRIFARVHELALLLQDSKDLLNSLQLDEPSCTLSHDDIAKDYTGVGVVEAARGSLIHETSVKEGCIENYTIVTPTQWNLSNDTPEDDGIATMAMRGSTSIEEATFIFRAFDVCSVCTTK